MHNTVVADALETKFLWTPIHCDPPVVIIMWERGALTIRSTKDYQAEAQQDKFYKAPRT